MGTQNAKKVPTGTLFGTVSIMSMLTLSTMSMYSMTISTVSKGPFKEISLPKHVKIVHGEQKKVVCNVCSKTFGLETALNSHMKRIHEDKNS